MTSIKRLRRLIMATATILCLGMTGGLVGAQAQSGHEGHQMQKPAEAADTGGHGAGADAMHGSGNDRAGRMAGAHGGMMMVHGSPTVARTALFPHKSSLDRASTKTIHVIANGSATGVMDLVAGRADVAMISAPIDAVRKSLERLAPGTVGHSEFVEQRIGTIKAHFVVHPSNPVRAISADDMRGVMTGRITNWRTLGGPDRPIVIFVTKPGSGMRSLIEAELLDGQSITSNARQIATLQQITRIISQVPQGIGFGNGSSIDRSVAVVDGLEFVQPLILLTRPAPDADVQAVVRMMMEMRAKI